jgi:integrase/recombinase XerD
MPYCWLKKRGSVWWLRYAACTNLKEESLRTTDKALAQEVQRRRESELFFGVRGYAQMPVRRIRYSELIKLYVEHKHAEGLAEKTVKNYGKLLNHFGKFLKTDPYANQVNQQMIEGFVSSRRAADCLPKTIRNEVFVLVGLFKWAMDENYITLNPMQRFKKPRRVVYDAPRYLTYEQYLALKAAIKNPRFADIVDFYLLSGIRREEGKRLTSENFDFENMTLTVYQSKQGTTKRIPISQDLNQVSRRLLARVKPGEPIIPLHVSRLTGNFAAARAKAKLPESITFHSLRHSFGSWLAAAGVDMRMIQELIGHRDAASTAVYVHAFDPNRRSAIEKLRLPTAKAS